MTTVALVEDSAPMRRNLERMLRKPGRKERPLLRRGSSSIIVVVSCGYARGNMPCRQTTRTIRLIIGASPAGRIGFGKVWRQSLPGWKI